MVWLERFLLLSPWPRESDCWDCSPWQPVDWLLNCVQTHYRGPAAAHATDSALKYFKANLNASSLLGTFKWNIFSRLVRTKYFVWLNFTNIFSWLVTHVNDTNQWLWSPGTVKYLRPPFLILLTPGYGSMQYCFLLHKWSLSWECSPDIVSHDYCDDNIPRRYKVTTLHEKIAITTCGCLHMTTCSHNQNFFSQVEQGQ